WIKDNVHGKNILDVGPMGGGGSLFAHQALRSANPEANITALDINIPEWFEKKIGSKGVKASVYNMPLENESFDCIFMGEILEHLENPYKAIKEVSRVMKEGGRLYLTTPNTFTYQNIIRALKNR
ncbi:unnamed protein product, partial [marine sediment metagenome]